MAAAGNRQVELDVVPTVGIGVAQAGAHPLEPILDNRMTLHGRFVWWPGGLT